MARNGVTYETIKHTAVKLLSQGIAPSVQKIRETLGTGSNTTIAEHLKTWREEYASKEIHHLPTDMPKELISAIEVLWQTAMDQATNQLSTVKQELSEAQEKLRLDRVAMEKAELDLKKTIDSLQDQDKEKNITLQKLQMEIAISQEKLSQLTSENEKFKSQYEARLQRAYHEKDLEIDKNKILEAQIIELNNKIKEQADKHQAMLNDERASQEESEKRWVKLIDEARVETKNQREQLKKSIDKQSKQNDKLQSMLSELQHKQIAQQSTIEQKNDRITELSNQNTQLQEKLQTTSTTVAILQERINQKNNELAIEKEKLHVLKTKKTRKNKSSVATAN